MTNPTYTAVKLVIDRSGSMASIQEEAEGAVNEFINSQRVADGRRTISISAFDDQYEKVCVSTDAANVPEFVLIPRGMTALLDAMGRSLQEFGDELAAMEEDQRPGTVIYAVMTDGYENASREYDWEKVQKIVERQRNDYGWHILYLGANQDAIAVGAKLGVDRGSTMTYAATGHGTRSAMNSVSTYVASAATGQSAAFTDAQREDAQK